MHIPSLTMYNGLQIPQVGFGLWKVTNEAEFRQAVLWALQAGYRHFDTAQAYGNEQWLGSVLREQIEAGTVTREELFITTKIAVEHFGHKHTLHSFEDSLEKLGLEYVDLLLLHFPVTLLRGKSWQALEEIHAADQAKSIGVSNYTVRHLTSLLDSAKVKPAVNQVELHVFLQQPELREFCKQHDIVVEAYSPLAHGQGTDNSVLAEIAQKHGVSTGQVMLRWCIEQGAVPLPKSVHQERIVGNIDLFNFSFDDEDTAALAKLEKGLRTCWDPTHIP